jgi:hypothetical protein
MKLTAEGQKPHRRSRISLDATSRLGSCHPGRAGHRLLLRSPGQRLVEDPAGTAGKSTHCLAMSPTTSTRPWQARLDITVCATRLPVSRSRQHWRPAATAVCWGDRVTMFLLEGHRNSDNARDLPIH